MRLNLVEIKSRGTTIESRLLHHLAELFAGEYLTNRVSVVAHLKSAHDPFGQAVADFLAECGWHIKWYSLPVPPEVQLSEWSTRSYDALSFGFVLSDDCPQLMAWRLANQ